MSTPPGQGLDLGVSLNVEPEVRVRARPLESVGRGLAVAARSPVVLLIRFYQAAISPWTAPSCRYYPSCSQYALVAVQRHGLIRGGWLALRRLGRCHPWTPGGVDHVPPARAHGEHPGHARHAQPAPSPAPTVRTTGA